MSEVITMRNKTLLFTYLYFILLTFFSLHIPFFWDGTFFSEISVHFFKEGYNGFISPEQTDTGGFPMYSAYLTLCWKIFGKSLAVSHIAILPFLLGIAFEYFKLAKRYLSDKMLFFAMVLLIIEPVLITQSVLMGYDILMVWLFLLSLNLLLSNKYKLFSIALIFLCMSSMRGVILGISLLVIDYLLNKKISIFWFSKYVPTILIIIVWSIYHHQQTGWFFFSPQREKTDESFLPFSMAIKQAGYIIWKINDFGRVVLWIFMLIAGFRLYKKTKSENFFQLVKIVFVPMIILLICMSFLANPVGHKYFIVVFLCLQIAICYLLQQISSSIKRNVLFISFCIVLIAGNFWIYPERYGNGWDSSLKILPFFELKNKMDEYIIQNKIPLEKIGTQYPLIADKRFSHLLDSSFHYTNVWKGPVSNYDYYLQSNVINTDIPEQIEKVKKSWTLLKMERSGQVYIELYSRMGIPCSDTQYVK